VRLLSTGGTARLLADAGLPVTEVAEVTGFPEMLDGRVKTLHPRIHGGLLARRDLPAHMAALAAHGIGTIDLLVVNLYPFAQATARADCTLEDAIENIDIGGPAMLRAAAKNWADVAVVIDPADYAQVLAELGRAACSAAPSSCWPRRSCAHRGLRRHDHQLPQRAAARRRGQCPAAVPACASPSRPSTPAAHQDAGHALRREPAPGAAFYREGKPGAGLLAGWTQLQGKELSYNNIADADAAWECVKTFDVPACVIVKHANPCGVAVGASAGRGLWQGLADRPHLGLRRHPGLQPAAGRSHRAPDRRQQAVRRGADRPAGHARSARRSSPPSRTCACSRCRWAPACQRAGLQARGRRHAAADARHQERGARRTARRHALAPTEAQMDDLLFAWKVAKFVKSNAIVFCGGGMTLGVGAGQMSRIDSARIARIKAGNAGLSLAGSAVASDAFFPFRDGLDVVIDEGAACVIQPGGSMRDDEVIAAADERGIAMVFTGTRHFRH
jgi:phosphoribosylaminoimidazolecarboxamide formyltransferase/IMP cyclohydrolase